jgi:hypothetical protein
MTADPNKKRRRPSSRVDQNLAQAFDSTSFSWIRFWPIRLFSVDLSAHLDVASLAFVGFIARLLPRRRQ